MAEKEGKVSSRETLEALFGGKLGALREKFVQDAVSRRKLAAFRAQRRSSLNFSLR